MDDHVIWDGSNADEIEAFAERGTFGFVVGSDYYRKVRFFHRWAEQAEVWWHRYVWMRTRASVALFGARLLSRLSTPRDDPSVLEIYPPSTDGWHWTTARPGDRIDLDGRVERS